MVNHKSKSLVVERKIPKEIERKFIPKHPGVFKEHRTHAYPIEQVYLSHPNEPWSLRLREVTTNQRQTYSAALKSRSASEEILIRDEVETPITEEAYRFYADNQGFPRIHKLRAEPYPGLTIDWVEGYEDPVIEAETPDAQLFLDEMGYELQDVTSVATYQNEMMAHLVFRAQQGEVALPPQADLDIKAMIEKIMQQLRPAPLVVGLIGRSGSGKSTLAGEIVALLEAQSVTNMILSTDDYNRGKTWLCERFGVPKWHNWDDPVVYDCESLACDLEALKTNGNPIKKRCFDFGSEEPIILDDHHMPAQVIILEGLFAHSSHFKGITDLSYALPTPLATSIGRRVYRDISNRDNASFGSAAEILRYQLEVVEPSYQKASAK